MKNFIVTPKAGETDTRGPQAMPSRGRTTSCWALRATAALCAALAMAGCTSKEETAAINEQMKNPRITKIGTFDGCEVKYVNRYYAESSFFLARCDSTTATTGREKYQSGKSTLYRDRLSITHQIAELTQELSALEAREAALAKLTPAERAALGLPKDIAPASGGLHESGK